MSATSREVEEIAAGERFEFGSNWSEFLALVDEDRVSSAMESLRRMLEVVRLDGKRFLDVGSGSGLSSLAARRLGATVHSFDADPASVACTRELRRRFAPDDAQWTIESASVLDAEHLRSLGTFDVVHAWGVLHHTGAMWQALELVTSLVAPGGALFVALYNDMGTQSVRWRWIKRAYNRLPKPLRPAFTAAVMLPSSAKALVRAMLPGHRASEQVIERGMNRWHDFVDWVGGYPYEVATPDEVFDFYRSRGFTLTKLRCGKVGLGCNEFVFVKT